MAITQNGSTSYAEWNSSSSSTPSLSAIITTTVAQTVLVAAVQCRTYGGAASPITVSSVTDTAGLTWTKIASTNHKFTANDLAWLNVEFWYAYAPTTLASNQVTATFTSGSNYAVIAVSAYAGVQNTANPFGNPNIAAAFAEPASGTISQTFLTHAAVTNITVGAALVQFMTAEPSSMSAGSGMTQQWEFNLSPIYASLGEWEPFSSGLAAGNYPLTTTGNNEAIGLAVTISGDSGPTSGTIDTALTKLSMSASGRVDARGTISTSLTKASLSASALVEILGTATTHLSGVSQTAQGHTNAVGTISTNLTKPSQSLSGTANLDATITTRLSGFSQSASGNMTLAGETGTITSRLGQISQSAGGWVEAIGTIETKLQPFGLSLQAQEIISGTIDTALGESGGFASGIVAQELMIGTITTRLSGFSQLLTGFEEIVGTINTRLGGANGQLVGDAIGGEVIIQGPIVMNLAGFEQTLLGAKLKSPGAGDWQTWRYTDS